MHGVGREGGRDRDGAREGWRDGVREAWRGGEGWREGGEGMGKDDGSFP